MERAEVMIVGGAGTELTARGPCLPRPGTAVIGDTFLRSPGGRGVGVAIAAARLGAGVGLVARVGADERGAEVLSRCRSEGVEPLAVAVDPDVATGAAVTMVDATGRRQSLSVPGANGRLTAEDVDAAAALIADAPVLVVTLDIPIDAALQAIRLGKAAGARVITDAGSIDLVSAELLRGVDVIRCGPVEAEVLTGVEVTDKASSHRAAENLILRGAAAAVVGAPGGSMAVSREGHCWIPIVHLEAVDSSGTEEAFTAALAVATAWEEDLFDAAWFATGAAVLAARRLGALSGLPRQEEVAEWLHRHRERCHGHTIERAAARRSEEARAPWSSRDRDSERPSAPSARPNRVDEASLESFPASDPPAWTPSHV